MYSVFFHGHQKIDRIARRHLTRLSPKVAAFPTIKEILYFEGQKGPDATKLKKLGVEQPWHFVDPFDMTDTDLDKTIADHHKQLIAALKDGNKERAAFEASWLAHALVDGLTPAHHHPYEAKLAELRDSPDRNDRANLMGRLIVKGGTKRDSFSRSLKLIGPKGLLMTHAAFEGGVFAILMPLRLEKAYPTEADLKRLREVGMGAYFRQTAKEIAVLDLYDKFYENGWTPKLARLVRSELAPALVRCVTLAWYDALLKSGKS